MSNQQDVSHRQEREHKKEAHAGPTPGKYFSSKHVSWTLAVAVIVMLAAVIYWTFFVPARPI